MLGKEFCDGCLGEMLGKMPGEDAVEGGALRHECVQGDSLQIEEVEGGGLCVERVEGCGLQAEFVEGTASGTAGASPSVPSFFFNRPVTFNGHVTLVSAVNFSSAHSGGVPAASSSAQRIDQSPPL